MVRYSQTWHESFLKTTAAFRGLQQCDCFRPSQKNTNWKHMSFESRVTRCNGVVLEYHQHFGPTAPLTGRLPLLSKSFADAAPSGIKMERVCNSSSSSSSSSESCLGDGRFLWGGDIMDCAPPGVTQFDVLPPCDPPWQMHLIPFLERVGSSGGVDILLLNYGAPVPSCVSFLRRRHMSLAGAHTSGESNATFAREVLAAGAAAVAPRHGTALWKTSYIVNPAWFEDRQLELPAAVADVYGMELMRMRHSGDAECALAGRWRVLEGQLLTCLLPRSGFEDKFHVKSWVTGNINVALLRMLMERIKE